MPSSARFNLPVAQWMDGSGDPLSGGRLYFYESGTTTPLAVYQDAGLTTAFTQPVTADADGVWPEIWLATGLYSVELTDSTGSTTIWLVDDFDPSVGSTELMLSYDSVAGLKATRKPVSAVQGFLRGYYASEDGGGGPVRYDPSSTETANDRTVFAPDEGGTGRWLRILPDDGFLTARQAGLIPNVTTDQGDAIQDLLTDHPRVDLGADSYCMSPRQIDNSVLTHLRGQNGQLKCVSTNVSTGSDILLDLVGLDDLLIEGIEVNGDLKVYRCIRFKDCTNFRVTGCKFFSPASDYDSGTAVVVLDCENGSFDNNKFWGVDRRHPASWPEALDLPTATDAGEAAANVATRLVDGPSNKQGAREVVIISGSGPGDEVKPDGWIWSPGYPRAASRNIRLIGNDFWHACDTLLLISRAAEDIHVAHNNFSFAGMNILDASFAVDIDGPCVGVEILDNEVDMGGKGRWAITAHLSTATNFQGAPERVTIARNTIRTFGRGYTNVYSYSDPGTPAYGIYIRSGRDHRVEGNEIFGGQPYRYKLTGDGGADYGQDAAPHGGTVHPHSVQILAAGAVVGTDNGLGSISGPGVSTGAVDYQTGEIAVTLSSALSSPQEFEIRYVWSYRRLQLGVYVGNPAPEYPLSNNVVRGNRVHWAENYGIYVVGPDSLVEGNQAYECGTGIAYIQRSSAGLGATLYGLVGNTAVRCRGSSFQVRDGQVVDNLSVDHDQSDSGVPAFGIDNSLLTMLCGNVANHRAGGKKAVGLIDSITAERLYVIDNRGYQVEWPVLATDVVGLSGGTVTSFYASGNTPLAGGFGAFSDKPVLRASAAPTTGTWTAGAIVLNSAPGGGLPLGWVCGIGGTPGTWVPLTYSPLDGSFIWNPGTIAAGAIATTTELVANTSVGSFVLSVSPSGSLGGCVLLQAHLEAADSMKVTIWNPTAGAVALGSMNFRYRIERRQ